LKNPSKRGSNAELGGGTKEITHLKKLTGGQRVSGGDGSCKKKMRSPEGQTKAPRANGRTRTLGGGKHLKSKGI